MELMKERNIAKNVLKNGKFKTLYKKRGWGSVEFLKNIYFRLKKRKF